MNRVDLASRLVPASPGVVYQALVEESALLTWLPPSGMVARIADFDPRIGGGYRMTLTYRDAGGAGKTTPDSDEVTVRYVDLVPGAEVVQEVDFISEDPAYAGTMTMTWSLVAMPDGTEVTIRCDDVPPGIDPDDHRRGLAESLAGLAAYVEGISAR